MLFSNNDVNEYINKFININEILLLRKSFKNNFKICNYHNFIRKIKIYDYFNINKKDDYRIELTLSNDIFRYIYHEKLIYNLENRNIKNIYKIKVERIEIEDYNKTINDINLDLKLINNLLDIIQKKNIKKINSIELDIYYFWNIRKDLLYNYNNLLINIYTKLNNIDIIKNNMNKFRLYNNYDIKEYKDIENSKYILNINKILNE